MPPKLNFIPISTNECNAVENFEIRYGCSKSKFGEFIIGMNNENLCYLAFFEEGNAHFAIIELEAEWPNAILKHDTPRIEPFASTIFDDENDTEHEKKLDVLLKGTAFQIKVWKELTNIKSGSTASYESIAKAIRKPQAVRAVANAIASNRIAYVIPCHRVIEKSGNIGEYRWGRKRKQEILNLEKESN